jgi:aspartyl-tRNA(Asn)/glutamyl-tRNA(Gln) amidotransferase subunit A
MYNKSRGEGFGPEVKRRIILGTFALSSGYYDAYYLKAEKVRTLITEEFKTALNKYDIILTPTTPTTAFKVGEISDPLAMYLSDIATISANMTGYPAMSLPCGFAKGLPVGMQLIGKAFDETTLIRVGHTYQQLTNHHQQVPEGIAQKIGATT